MAQLVVGIAGAAVGYVIGGPQGAQLGFTLATTAYSLANQPKSTGPRLQDLKVTSAGYGQPIPWLRGAPRVSGVVWWSSDKRAVASTQGGKGGGPEVTTYTYEVDLMLGLCDHEIAAVTRVWSNGKLVYTKRTDADSGSINASESADLWRRFTVYPGSATQLPDPTYEAAVGTANAPAYRGRAYAFIEGLQLGSGGQLPNLTFEVPTSAAASTLGSSGPVIALLRGEGSGANFTDVVGGAFSITDGSPFNNAISDVGEMYLGSPSIRMDCQDIIRGPANAAYDFSGDWTIEFFGRCSVAGSGSFQIVYSYNGAVNGDVVVSLLPTNPPSITARSGSLTVGGSLAGTLATERHHFEVTKTGGIGRVFVDGTLCATSSLASFATLSTPRIDIGGSASASGFVWVSQLRITLGGRHVASFQPPAEPLSTAYFNALTTWAASNPTVQATVEALCARAGMPAGTYDASGLASITKPVRALAVAQVGATRGVLEQLGMGYYFETVLADKLYFRPRAASSVASIPYADLAAGPEAAGDQPLALSLSSDLELPPQVLLGYVNVSDDHQPGTEVSSRIVASQAAAQRVELGLGFTPAEAKGIADAIVVDNVASLLTTTISLPLSYTRLEPSDVVTVTDGDGASYRLRLVRRTEQGGVLGFEALVDDATAVVSSQVTSSAGYTVSNTVTATSATTLQLLDIPLLRDADDSPGYYVAAKGAAAGWPGASVLSSVNNTDFSQVAEVAEVAIFGTCTTTLGNYTGVGFDELNSVTVNVGTGDLASSTRTAMLADETVNAMVIGSEVIRFRTATGSAGVYVLTGLLRGQRGTEWAIGTHAASERCVLLGMSGMRRVTTQTSDTGQLRYIKGVTLGALASSATASQFTSAGIGERPFAPVDLRASKDPYTGDVAITWKRRTRLRTRFAGPAGISVPLGEAAESYRVRIYSDAGYTTLKRTLTPAAQSATYTQAQQVADFGSASATLYVRVAQVSASVGAGYEVAGAFSPSASVAGVTALSPVLFAASASGWLACTTAYQTSGLTGVINDQRVTSFWSASSRGGPYTLARSVTTATTAPSAAPAFTPVLGRIAQTSTYALQFSLSGTSGVFARATLDLSADPAVVTPSIAFAGPRILAGEASRFLLFGDTNKVHSSSDGVAWTLIGTMAGATFPHAIGDGTYLTHGIQKIGSRWFLVFGLGGGLGANADRLFYSDNADAQTGWTATSGISVGATQSLHEEVVYDGAKHYAAVSDFSGGTTTVYASSDGGITWASEYVTAIGTGFEVGTSGTTSALVAHLQVTGTTGSDYVRLYAVNGVVFEKLVGTTSWSAKASGLVNPQMGFALSGASAFYDGGAVGTAGGSQVRAETAGVCAVATGF